MANVPSFKSRDAHANIQVTFMTHTDTGAMAADIDIDEASGIEHGFEVIKNAVFRRRTNPYLIREFMAIAARQHRSRADILVPVLNPPEMARRECEVSVT